MRKVMIVAVLVLACGGPTTDPRLQFLGHYTGSYTLTVTPSGGTASSSTGNLDTEITSEPNSQRLVLSGACGLTATVRETGGFSVEDTACPVVINQDTHCSTAIHVTGGLGTVGARLLNLDWSGTFVVSQCTANNQNGSGQVGYSGNGVAN